MPWWRNVFAPAHLTPPIKTFVRARKEFGDLLGILIRLRDFELRYLALNASFSFGSSNRLIGLRHFKLAAVYLALKASFSFGSANNVLAVHEAVCVLVDGQAPIFAGIIRILAICGERKLFKQFGLEHLRFFEDIVDRVGMATTGKFRRRLAVPHCEIETGSFNSELGRDLVVPKSARKERGPAPFERSCLDSPWLYYRKCRHRCRHARQRSASRPLLQTPASR